MTQPTDNPPTDNLGLLALFEPFDSDWKSTTRSIRIDGTVTSVRLETFYWRVVNDIAEQQKLQVPDLMTRLSRVAKSGTTEHTNFTSFVRVCCGRYLDEQLRKSRATELTESVAALAEPVSEPEKGEFVEE